MPGLFSDAAADLVSSLHFRAARQGVLAANVANADTPGYRPSDLEFPALLAEEKMRMTRTHEQHMSTGGGSTANPYRLEAGPRGRGPERNGVDLDQELIRMKQNAGGYQDQAEILSRILGLTRSAIQGEG